MTGVIRPYDDERDLDGVLRVWRDVGWLNDDDRRGVLGAFLAGGHAEVAPIDDDIECMVHWSPGTIDHTGTPLDLCAVTAVTTSITGRKQGFASTMTSNALRQGAEAGYAVAALGMFEQGFYDRLGFATGSYDVVYRFDPSNLRVDVPYRRPVRVTPDMWEDVHGALTRRLGHHGAVMLTPPRLVEGELGFLEQPFGLGYRDDSGALTHFVTGSMKGEHGPLHVEFFSYQDTDQLLELLRLLRELADQVRTVRMVEPPHVQMQSLLSEPFRDRMRTRSSEHEGGALAIAWWQLRILDVERCVAALDGAGDPLTFNLVLTDPLTERLDSSGWSGIAGDYTVTVDRPSVATPGHAAGAPVLRATVGAFSRLWFGVASATSLAATSDLDGPRELIDGLDRALRLPTPHTGWMF